MPDGLTVEDSYRLDLAITAVDGPDDDVQGGLELTWVVNGLACDYDPIFAMLPSPIARWPHPAASNLISTEVVPPVPLPANLPLLLGAIDGAGMGGRWLRHSRGR